MTVQQLINNLQRYPPTNEVSLYHHETGWWDIDSMGILPRTPLTLMKENVLQIFIAPEESRLSNIYGKKGPFDDSERTD